MGASARRRYDAVLLNRKRLVTVIFEHVDDAATVSDEAMAPLFERVVITGKGKPASQQHPVERWSGLAALAAIDLRIWRSFSANPHHAIALPSRSVVFVTQQAAHATRVSAFFDLVETAGTGIGAGVVIDHARHAITAPL